MGERQMRTAELKVLPVASLKPAEYNPRKKLKPGDKEYQKIKERADKLIPKSDDWYDLQYDMDLQSGVIKGLKKLLDETT